MFVDVGGVAEGRVGNSVATVSLLLQRSKSQQSMTEAFAVQLARQPPS